MPESFREEMLLWDRSSWTSEVRKGREFGIPTLNSMWLCYRFKAIRVSFASSKFVIDLRTLYEKSRDCILGYSFRMS